MYINSLYRKGGLSVDLIYKNRASVGRSIDPDTIYNCCTYIYSFTQPTRSTIHMSMIIHTCILYICVYMYILYVCILCTCTIYYILYMNECCTVRG